MAIVARLLRGEPLELVVRETNVKSKPARGDGDRFSVLPVGPQVSCVVRSTGSSTGWRSSQTLCVLRYDNEAGKGDHRHIGRVEKLYKFVDPETIIS